MQYTFLKCTVDPNTRHHERVNVSQSPVRNEVNTLERCMFGEAAFQLSGTKTNPFTSLLHLAIKNTCAISCGEEKKLMFYTYTHARTHTHKLIQKNKSLSATSEASNKSSVCWFKVKKCHAPEMERLWLVGGAGSCGLVVAAVHLLLHGAVLLQLLAGVVGDLQEAAGLHHHVGLAGVRQDGELRDHLHGSH